MNNGKPPAKRLGRSALADVATVHGWFDEAALQSYGYPTDEVCRAFAVTLKRAANHAANAQLEKAFASREPSIFASKDVTPDQIVSMRWRAVQEAANHLAYALAQFEEFVPRQKWGGHCGFSEVSNALDLMSAYPE